MPVGATRRAVLFSLVAAAARAARNSVFPPEVFKYTDALTEFPVERLTSPGHSAWLPDSHCRAAARRPAFLVYASDRAGAPQLFRLDHSTGASRQLTEAAALDRRFFTLAAGDRSLVYLDGPSLRVLAINSLKEREIYRVREGWRIVAGLAAPPAKAPVLIVEERDGVCELRAVSLERRKAETVLHCAGMVDQAILAPGGKELCYVRDGSLRLASADGRWDRAAATAEGRIWQVFWRPDGEAVLYLLTREDGRREIRETGARGGADALVSAATRYAAFSPNADGSVFAGAIGSAAQPHMVLLLRSVRRELTICEHRSSRPKEAAPAFSPDSQRVYFQSDVAGRPAIFSVRLNGVLEQT
jgi:oligogalacturonide lyase